MASKNRVSASAPGNSFTKPNAPARPEFDPTRPGAFDIAGFLAGAREHTNTRTLAVTSRPDVAAELERLHAEADQIRAVQAEPEDSPRRRVSQKSGKAQRLEQIEQRIAELEPQLEGTWLEVKMRGITPSEQDDVRALKLNPGVPLAAAIFEKACLVRGEGGTEDDWEPLDRASWEALIDAMGPVQYVALDKAHEGLAYQAVTPDFYERYSASRATRSTSAS